MVGVLTPRLVNNKTDAGYPYHCSMNCMVPVATVYMRVGGGIEGA